MIQESTYWKGSLAKHAELINGKLRQRKWTEASFGRLEEALVISSFIVRKLHESKKIDPLHCEKSVRLWAYPSNGKHDSLLLGRHPIEIYDGAKKTDVSKPLAFVLNQLIHSYVLQPVFVKENMLKYYAFNSDRTKKNEMYLVDLKVLAESFASVAGSYLSGVTIFQVGAGGELKGVPQKET